MFKKQIFISKPEIDSIVMRLLRNKSQTKILLRLHFSNNSTTKNVITNDITGLWRYQDHGRIRIRMSTDDIKSKNRHVASKQRGSLKFLLQVYLWWNNTQSDNIFSASYFFYLSISLIKHIEINIGNVLCKIIYNNFLKTVNPQTNQNIHLDFKVIFYLNKLGTVWTNVLYGQMAHHKIIFLDLLYSNLDKPKWT